MDCCYQPLPKKHPLQATVCLPGSKSLAARALVLGALHPGHVSLESVPLGKDTQVMIQALQSLGFQIDILSRNDNEISLLIKGLGGEIPVDRAIVDVYESGTVARFLPCLIGLHKKGIYQLEGQSGIQQRPMKGLLEVLKGQGCTFRFTKSYDHYPFLMETCGLKGGCCEVDTTDSSQFLSGLLMVSAYADQPLIIGQKGQLPSAPFVELTTDLMQVFGYEIINDCWVKPLKCDITYQIPPDATAASYFMGLVTLRGGSLRIVNGAAMVLQNDYQLCDILKPYGLKIESVNQDLIFYSEGLKKPFDQCMTFDFKALSDTFITFAAMVPFLGHSVKLIGLRHTRLQESNRLEVVADQLVRMGQCVEVFDDGLCIYPQTLQPATIDPANDHRMAMAFGMVGCLPIAADNNPWLSIKNPHVCQKTFPNFFEVLDQVN